MDANVEYCSPPASPMLSPPMPVEYIDDEDEDDKGTDEKETNDLQGSTIALNIRFNDKSIPQNYRNSIFAYPSTVEINDGNVGKRGLIHSTEKINSGKMHGGSRLVPHHQKHNSDGEGALDQALYS